MIEDFFVGGFAAMRYIRPMDELTRDHGLQPLDGLMVRWNIANHELVEVSAEQLNHKQVQKARKGRQLTLQLMQKLMRALNDTIVGKLAKEDREKFTPYLHKHLFSYAKNYDAVWVDPNETAAPKSVV